jgi:D-sedoheptulose 7-phosphate isomerase
LLPADSFERLQRHILESIEAKKGILAHCQHSVIDAAALIARTMAGGNKLMLCGNGGSAADSQHIAAEFVNVLNQGFPRRALPALALTTDTSILTACSNDFGFDGAFARQVQAIGRPGDVLLGISTSGNSQNIVEAVESARRSGIHTVALTGGQGGRLAALADIAILVPSDRTQHIQECHITIGHILCDLVEQALCE